MKWFWILYRQRRLTRTFVTGWRRLFQIQQQTQPGSSMEVQRMQEIAKIWQRSPILMGSWSEGHRWSPSSLKLSMQNHNSEIVCLPSLANCVQVLVALLSVWSLQDLLYVISALAVDGLCESHTLDVRKWEDTFMAFNQTDHVVRFILQWSDETVIVSLAVCVSALSNVSAFLQHQSSSVTYWVGNVTWQAHDLTNSSMSVLFLLLTVPSSTMKLAALPCMDVQKQQPYLHTRTDKLSSQTARLGVQSDCLHILQKLSQLLMHLLLCV